MPLIIGAPLNRTIRSALVLKGSKTSPMTRAVTKESLAAISSIASTAIYESLESTVGLACRYKLAERVVLYLYMEREGQRSS